MIPQRSALFLCLLALSGLAWAEDASPTLPEIPRPPAEAQAGQEGESPAPGEEPQPHPGTALPEDAAPPIAPVPGPASVPSIAGHEEVRHDPIRLEASVDNSRPSIGDWVTYRLHAEGPEGVEFTRAELPPKLPDYVALRGRVSSEAKRDSGRVRRTWEFTLDFFFSGTFPLPPFLVTYRGLDGVDRQVLAPVFVIDVQGLPLDPQHASDIRPNRGMKAIPVSFRRYYVAASIALAAVLALAIAWVWLTHGWRRPEESPPVPAHLIAYEQMRRLVEDRLVEHGRIEEYYVRLSDICRHYLENRFNLRAPERTTEEFLVEVSGTALLTGPQKGLVRDFLGHCDLVKFARYGPDDREMREAFEAAKRLVDETREDTEEEEPQAAPPAVASVDPQTSG